MNKRSLYIIILIIGFCYMLLPQQLFSQVQQYSSLHITELHYHPLDSITPMGDTIKSKNFEFIELKNRSNKNLAMKGCRIDGGIRYHFKEDAVIKANDFFVLAEDKKMFKDTYGFKANGRYKGKLSNNGEAIYVLDPYDEIIDVVEYSDDYSWTKGTDGDGKSLVLIPGSDNDNALSWATLKHGASPNKDHINFENAYKLTYLKVTNVLGREMISLDGDEISEYDLKELSDDWPTGVYLVEVIQNDNLYQDTFVKH